MSDAATFIWPLVSIRKHCLLQFDWKHIWFYWSFVKTQFIGSKLQCNENHVAITQQLSQSYPSWAIFMFLCVLTWCHQLGNLPPNCVYCCPPYTSKNRLPVILISHVLFPLGNSTGSSHPSIYYINLSSLGRPQASL